MGEAWPFSFLSAPPVPGSPGAETLGIRTTEAQEAGLVQWNGRSSPLSPIFSYPTQIHRVSKWPLTCLHLATRSPGQRGAQLICPCGPHPEGHQDGPLSLTALEPSYPESKLRLGAQ